MKITLPLALGLALSSQAFAVLTTFTVTHNFASPGPAGSLGPASWTVTGVWGSFDITVVDGNGNPGGFFDNGLGIGGTDGVDFGINNGDGPLTFTFDNYTGALASTTGGTQGHVLLKHLDFGRFGTDEADAGIYFDSNGNNFSFSQGGVGRDTSIPVSDLYVFGTPLTNNPANNPTNGTAFPAIGGTGEIDLGQGGSFSLVGTAGNPRWDLERLQFTIVVPEPSRGLLLALGFGSLICRRRRY